MVRILQIGLKLKPIGQEGKEANCVGAQESAGDVYWLGRPIQ
jgi:hypothetical protein